MKFNLLLIVGCFVTTNVYGFIPLTTGHRPTTTRLFNYESTVTEEQLNHKLESIAYKLRLQVYDVNTGVYGFESVSRHQKGKCVMRNQIFLVLFYRTILLLFVVPFTVFLCFLVQKDPKYGIENIRVTIPIEPSLGLELTEVAHSTSGHKEGDARGLVLVSKVSGNAASANNIQIGDAIVGVFCEDADFKETVTGFDYEDTMEVLSRAKTHAHMMADTESGDGASISLELNRLVPRAKVSVIVEGATDKPQLIEGLAGDNLRLLLMHHDINIYGNRLHRLDMPSVTDSNCGGEGICGTCMVEILEGNAALNNMGPKEQEVTTGRPTSWRAACQTVIGADNQESTIRVRVHPQWLKDGHD